MFFTELIPQIYLQTELNSHHFVGTVLRQRNSVQMQKLMNEWTQEVSRIMRRETIIVKSLTAEDACSCLDRIRAVWDEGCVCVCVCLSVFHYAKYKMQK